ncbi:MAG TPA: hypothetical protein VNA25_26970 [Phycisphaerae bacterium]|nr:hypothetical protein [Phycisphaerae bacterium]
MHRPDFRIDWVGTVLDSLESAFARIAEKGREQPWFDGLFQMEQAEAIFGVSFVTAQVYILGTWREVNRSRQSAGKRELEKIRLYSDAAHCDGTNTSTILLVHQIANYYKHHDEWGDPWPNNHTTTALADVGIDANTEFPCCRAAAMLFGEDHAWQFGRFREMLAEWRQRVLSTHV